MNNKDSLGDRMKNYYENISRTYLTRRTPVIIRIDGKAFHTFTRGFKKPFDEVFVKSMQDTMKYLCENIQGCVLGYTQSDEITLVLIDYQTLETDAWFGYNIQKMCSVAASMATMAFNKAFMNRIWDYENEWRFSLTPQSCEIQAANQRYVDTLKKAVRNGAMFDARCFNIPKEEVCNCLLWRQQDATRNSIQSVGQANFSQKELYGKSCNMIQDMLLTKKDINWNNYPTTLKRGSCCIKEEYSPDPVAIGCEDYPIDATKLRTRWVIDNEIPIFSQDRSYIENLI